MSNGTLSILGLYNYGSINDDDLFENLKLPNGIDRDDVINNILEQCAEFECLYTDFDYMKMSIGLWSKRWYRTFDKWFKALSIKYEPLWNFDRTEEYTDTENEKTVAHGESENIGHTETSDTIDETDTNSVVAYNSDTLHLKEQDVIDRDGSSTSDDTVNGKADTEETRDKVFSHKAKLYGNIGVTTSQQMLESELEIAKWNLTQHIVDCFKVDMCILVY